MATLFPVSVDIHVHITDGQVDGSAKYNFGLNRLPSAADMPEVFSKIQSALPDGFRLMTRHESLMYFLRNEKGYRGPDIALPAIEKGDEWHDPETANTMSFRDQFPDEDEE